MYDAAIQELSGPTRKLYVFITKSLIRLGQSKCTRKDSDICARLSLTLEELKSAQSELHRLGLFELISTNGWREPIDECFQYGYPKAI
jgi:hypothetical protein